MQIRVAGDARIFGKRHEQISGAGVLRLCGAVLSPSGSFVAPTQMLMVMVFATVAILPCNLPPKPANHFCQAARRSEH